jgi:hypothetical protein
MEVFPLAKTDRSCREGACGKDRKRHWGTIRPFGNVSSSQAAADVSADKIKAEGETEVELVRRRGLQRLAAEETKKQINLEAIYGKTFQICLESGVGSATIEQRMTTG